MRFGRIFLVIVIMVCMFEAVRLWSVAPDQMAAHFNIRGEPDRFAPKAEIFGSQLKVGLVVIVISLITQVLLLFLPPVFINIPHPEYWLAPERRAETVDRIGSFAATLFGIILLSLLAGFELTISASLRQPASFDPLLMLPIMAGSFLIILMMIFWLTSSFKIPSSRD